MQRILCHESLYDDLRQRLVQAVKALRAGDPRDEGTFLGPMIDQAAADAVFTGRDDLGHVLVARERKLRAQPREVEPFALCQEKGERGQIRGRRQSIQGRGRRDQQHVAFAPRRMVERSKALGN